MFTVKIVQELGIQEFHDEIEISVPFVVAFAGEIWAKKSIKKTMQ